MQSRPNPTSPESTGIQVAVPAPMCRVPNSSRQGRRPSSPASRYNQGKDTGAVRKPATPADRTRLTSLCQSARPMLPAAPSPQLRKISNTALQKHCIVFVFVSWFLLPAKFLAPQPGADLKSPCYTNTNPDLSTMLRRRPTGVQHNHNSFAHVQLLPRATVAQVTDSTGPNPYG